MSTNLNFYYVSFFVLVLEWIGDFKWTLYVSFERCAEDFAEIRILIAQIGLLNFEVLRSIISRQICILWMSYSADTPIILRVSDQDITLFRKIDIHFFHTYIVRSQLYNKILHYISSTIILVTDCTLNLRSNKCVLWDSLLSKRRILKIFSLFFTFYCNF